MFEDKDKVIALLRSPLNIQAAAIDEIESRLGGDLVISDNNSPFCHLLEFGSSINALAIQATDNKFDRLYPKRAKTTEDLFQHMSDYDYVDMYSTPSSASLKMVFSKKYLTDYALDYNSNYKRVTIPKETEFRIGKYSFGLYYPINIDINKFTNTFTVTYDTTTTNPLHSLNKNIVDKYDTEIGGLQYLLIEFPVYQFSKTTAEASLIAATGFVKTFKYNHKFYAIRLFNYFGATGIYEELNQTQSNTVYDITKPTAVVQVVTELQKIKIFIPQVYFDKRMMGSNLIAEVYTTAGALDIDVSGFTGENLSANFALKHRDTTKFSRILKNLPFDNNAMMQLSSKKILGGSDGIEFEDLRNMVVDDTFYDTVPITTKDIEKSLKLNNFYVEKYLDDVTDRIYYCYGVLTDNKKSVIPSTTLPTKIMMSYLEDRNTLIRQSDESITILPITVYKFNPETLDAVPLTNEEMEQLSEMDKYSLAEALNSTHYLRSPFHVRLAMEDRYPKATSYNLMNPQVKAINMVNENPSVAAQLISLEATITHLNSGVGGYKFDIYVSKSDDMKKVDEEFIKVYLFTKTADGRYAGRIMDYVETGDTTRYTTELSTTYRITDKDEIELTNLDSQTSITEHLVPLESDYFVVFLTHESQLPDTTEQADYATTSGVPAAYLGTHIALSRQYFTLSLGTNLSQAVKNNVETSWSAQRYTTWKIDVPKVYVEDEYSRDENGALLYPIAVEHTAGEPVLDDAGYPTYEHRIGDVRYSVDGTPIVDTDRVATYFVDMMFIDAKMFASEHATQIQFIENLTSNLEVYFKQIVQLNTQLRERNFAYFRPIRSIGSANYHVGDDIISVQSLEMEFKIRCYVPAFVMADESIRDSIRELMTTLIEIAINNKTISMLDIFQNVKNQMSDYISHIDLLGINGDTTLQTMVVVDKDAQPSIARKLVVTEGNLLILQKQILIEFASMDQRSEA